jgi:hypothetical protein
LEDLRVDGRIILELMSLNSAGRAWTEWGQMAGFCAHGNETSGCVKCGEFLD